MPAEFKGKVVLVTGAGSGIGRAAAQLFAARGALVYCAGRQEAKLAETRALIEAAGAAHASPLPMSRMKSRLPA